MQLDGSPAQRRPVWHPDTVFTGRLEPADPGTVRHFFDRIYIPEIGFDHTDFANTRRCFRSMLEHYGRDVRLDELSEQLARDHCNWLLGFGIAQDTVARRYLSPWLKVWRYAHKCKQAAEPPALRSIVSVQLDVAELRGWIHEVSLASEPTSERFAGELARSYARTVYALSAHLGRHALASDLTPETITSWLRCRIGGDHSRERMETHIANITAIWGYAFRHGRTPSKPPGSAGRITYEAILGELSKTVLRCFFHASYRPKKLPAADRATLASYSRSIERFSKFLGRPALLGDLTADNVVPWLRGRFAKKSTRKAADMHRKNVAALWQYASDEGLAARFDAAVMDADAIWVPSKPGPKAKAIDPLPDDPGTLRRFFEDVYKPQQLMGVREGTKDDYDRMLRRLRQAMGRDVKVSELSDKLAAEFMNWLMRRDVQPITVNSYRAWLFAIWRFAYDRRLVEHLPRVKKLKELIDEPDAWTEAETLKIIETASGLTGTRNGFSRGKLWRAFLLCGYWTALRRGSLMAIRRADVDLDGGWLAIPPNRIKNRRGKRFRIGDDAVQAIRAIWLPEREMLFPQGWDKNHMCDDFNAILARARIPKSRRKSMTQMHKWRRTVATLVAARGGMAAAIALLGHSGADVTKRYLDPTKLPGNDATQILPMLGIAATQEAPADSPQSEALLRKAN